MCESEKETISEFPFNVWMATSVGPLPLIGRVNRHRSDLKVYSENELSWEEFGVGSDAFDALMKNARECRAAIKTRFEEANAKIKLLLDGKNTDKVAALPILPKTPGKTKKRRTRKSEQETVRRSTRHTSRQLPTVLEHKPKLSNSGEISDVIQALGLNKPKRKRKSKKKPTTSSKHEAKSSEGFNDNSHEEAMDESSTEDTQASPKVQHLIEYHEKAIHNVQDSIPKITVDIAETPIRMQQMKSVTPGIVSNEEEVEETMKTGLTSSRKRKSTTNPRVLGGLAAKRRSSRKSLRLKTIAYKEAISQCAIEESEGNKISAVIDDVQTTDTQASDMEGITVAGGNDDETIEVEIERRQTRQMTSQTSKSTRSSRVLGGLAAKRRSSRISLRLQTIACKKAIIQSAPAQENASSSDTVIAPKQPSNSIKAVKPKIRRNLRPGNSKRTRGNCEPDVESNSASPKQKRFRKMPRTASFLNRSTAASRSRNTPGSSTPVCSRYRFCSPLRTPTSNINSTIKSFLVRNTPEKVDQQAELEAKKKKIEERDQKEAERKRKIEEERNEKIAQAAKQREYRLKRAARYRKEQWQTKLQKQLDKFEKQDIKAKQDQLKAKEEQEEHIRKIKQQEVEKAKEAARKKEEMKKEQEQKFKKEQEILEKAKKEQERLNKIKQQERDRANEAARRREEMKKEQEIKLMREKELKKLKEIQEEQQSKIKHQEKERAEEATRKREEMKKEQELKLMREHEMKKAKQEKEEHLKKMKAAAERILQLQSQNSSTCKDDSVNYDMTPRGPHRILAPSSDENYNIDDYGSGDSTDEEDRPKKTVPKWAKGVHLQASIIKQYQNPPDLDDIFRDLLLPVILEDLFKKNKPRYFKRTSSAQWNSPIMPHSHISFTENTKGF